MKNRRPHIDQRSLANGIALLSVLWVLMLLGMLAASAVVLVRQQATVTHRDAERARVSAAADAALVYTIARLSDTQSARHPAVGAAPQPWSFEGIATTYTVVEEDGRIDLNDADPWLLYGYLRSQGVSDSEAFALVGTLRTSSALSSAPNSTGEAAVRLRTPEELRQRPGWNRASLPCWLRDLTVYSGLPSVSVLHATPGARAALQWAEEHHLDNRSWLGADSGAQSFTAARSVIGDVLRIEATAQEGEVSLTRQWVGRVTGDATHPALTMRWDDRVGDCESATGAQASE